jgi:putative ABC transport system ATP-binding protein
MWSEQVMQPERLHVVPTDTPREILIRVSGVSKSYQRGPETVEVLRGLNLEVREGEFVALMGPSGSGKSTLLNLLGGIDRPTAGSIRVAGMDIDKLSESELAKWRGRHVGFVFQMYHLVSVMTAERNVELPLVLTDMGRAEREKRVRAALSLVGLADRAKHKPAELSGGQEQRVAIARAIVHSPELLLCDEPTGDLDATTGESILNLLKALNTEYGKTIIMVTHDQRAAAYARRTLHVSKGRLAVETGA